MSAQKLRHSGFAIFLTFGVSISACAPRADTATTPVIAETVVQKTASPDLVISEPYRQTIQNLTQSPKVQKAFTFIKESDAQNLEDLIEMTEIPAPPFGEEKRAAHFAQLLQEAGMSDVSIDAEGNVIARKKGTVGDKTIAVVAHLDTVFPVETDVTVRRKGDRYYAPGIFDCTRGLVVVLSMAKAMLHADIQTEANILFIGTVGEEGLGDLRGVKHLFRDGAEKIDSFIAVDSSGAKVVYGGAGSHRYRVTFKGPGGHSWGDFGMVNPHHALGRAIKHFDERALPITQTGPRSSYSVGRIGGGTSVNSIPFESWMEVDIRSVNQAKIDEIDAVFKASIQDAVREENEDSSREGTLTVDVKPVGKRPAALGDPESSLVQHQAAALETYGLTPSLVLSSTDSNIPISLGVPSITITLGMNGGGAHSLDEWWENKDSHIPIESALLTVLAEAKLN